MTMKQVFLHWSPAISCAFLIITYSKQINSSSSTAALTWLPMCFFFAGNVTYSMYKQIRALQSEVTLLRAQIDSPRSHA